MSKVLYVYCTGDKYQLPLYVAASVREMAEYLGVKPKTVIWYLTPTYHKRAIYPRLWRVYDD